MSIVGQPNTILTVYSPFAWIEDTTVSTGTGNFITYPTAQDAEITFPGSIITPKIDSLTTMSIADDSNNALTIGNRPRRTEPISIGSNMGNGIISIGGALTTTYLSNIESNSALSIADTTDNTITIGTLAGRLEQITIGTASNTTYIPKIDTSSIADETNTTLNIGTLVFRSEAINIGTSTNTTNIPKINTTSIATDSNTTLNIGTLSNRNSAINIGTSTNITTIPKIGTSSIADDTNTALTIGGVLNRTASITIGGRATSANIVLGTTTSLTKTTNLASDGTMDIQNSDRNGAGAINIACGDKRSGNIDIGVNTNTAVGQTTGSVNFMNGIARQEGSFNVLTNSANRGVINLGSTGSFEGGINIYASLKSGLRVGYSSGTYANLDTYIGSYKTATYATLGFTTTGSNQYVFGNIATIVSTGVYQVNILLGLTSSTNTNPYLTTGLYTKTGVVAWVNGAIMTGGTLVDSTSWTGKSYAPDLNDLFTIQVSGLLVLSAKAQVCIAIGYNMGTGNIAGVSQLSLTRIG